RACHESVWNSFGGIKRIWSVPARTNDVLKVRLDRPVLGDYGSIGQLDRGLIVGDRHRDTGERNHLLIARAQLRRNSCIGKADPSQIIRAPCEQSFVSEAKVSIKVDHVAVARGPGHAYEPIQPLILAPPGARQ